MTKRNKIIAVGATALALAAGGAGLAVAGGGGENDPGENMTGAGADKATEAALAITNGGTANSVELDNENGATWEVEVTKPSGETVDVRLDDNYDLVVVEGDSEDAGEAASGS
jgi:uncharacterized membrane protein YkoI